MAKIGLEPASHTLHIDCYSMASFFRDLYNFSDSATIYSTLQPTHVFRIETNLL